MKHFDSCLSLKSGNEEDCPCEQKSYFRVFGIGLLILLIEITGGYISGSLSLLADAGHVFVDNVAVIVAIFVNMAVKKHPHGNQRIRSIGGYFHALLLCAVAVSIFIGARDRLMHPTEVLGLAMLGPAFIGGVLNYVQHMQLSQSGQDHITNRGLRLHVLSDLWQSVMVVVGGVIIYYTNLFVVDAVLSFVISVVMMCGAISLFVESLHGQRASNHHKHHH